MGSTFPQKKPTSYFSSIKQTLNVSGIFRRLKHGIIEQSDLVSFPHTLWGVVKSFENLTPRGLAHQFSSNDSSDTLNTHSLDSFLLSRRREDNQSLLEECKESYRGTQSNKLAQ